MFVCKQDCLCFSFIWRALMASEVHWTDDDILIDYAAQSFTSRMIFDTIILIFKAPTQPHEVAETV